MAASVLDLDAPEDRAALADQALRIRENARIGLEGIVHERAEDTGPLHHHRPRLRNLRLDPAEHRVQVEHRLVARDVRLSQIELEAAEDGVVLRAGEVLVDDGALSAAEHRRLLGPRSAFELEAHLKNRRSLE